MSSVSFPALGVGPSSASAGKYVGRLDESPGFTPAALVYALKRQQLQAVAIAANACQSQGDLLYLLQRSKTSQRRTSRDLEPQKAGNLSSSSTTKFLEEYAGAELSTEPGATLIETRTKHYIRQRVVRGWVRPDPRATPDSQIPAALGTNTLLECPKCNHEYAHCMNKREWRRLRTLTFQGKLLETLQASRLLLRINAQPLKCDLETFVHCSRGCEPGLAVLFDLCAESRYQHLLQRLCKVFAAHGIFQNRSMVLETLSYSPFLGSETHGRNFVYGNLAAVLRDWRTRHALLFFVIQQISNGGADSEADVLPGNNKETVESYVRQTVEQALRGMSSPCEQQRSTCFRYLIDVFWYLLSESVVPNIPPSPLPSPATVLLISLIELADKIESEHFGPGQLSFIRTIFCQLQFKQALTRIANSLNANRHENADRRTERLRHLINKGLQGAAASTSHPPLTIATSSDASSPSSPPTSFECLVVGGEGLDRSSTPCGLEFDSTLTESERMLTLGKTEDLSHEVANDAEAIACSSGSILPVTLCDSDTSLQSGVSEQGVSTLKFTGNLFSLSVASLFASGSEAECRMRAARIQEDLLEMALRRTQSIRNQQLIPEVNLDPSVKFQKYFPLPTDPRLWFAGVATDTSYVVKSSKHPIVLDCLVREEGKLGAPAGSRKVMYKVNDDLRQDLLIIELFKWFEANVFQRLYGLETHLFRYRVLPMSSNEGLIEFVENATSMSQLKRSSETSLRALLEKASNRAEDSQRSTKTLSAFVASSAAYSVLTYICAVGDRHHDNLMVDTLGRFFHIDFGYILGNDPKPFPSVPMKITRDMIESLGGLSSDSYQSFCVQCVQLFYIMRKYSRQFSNLLSLTYSSEIPDVKRLRHILIAQEAADKVPTGREYRQAFNAFKSKVAERMRLDLDDAEAIHFLINEVVNVSVHSLFPVFVDKLHEWAVYWR